MPAIASGLRGDLTTESHTLYACRFVIAAGLQAYVYYNARAMGKMQGGQPAGPANVAARESPDVAGASEGGGRGRGDAVEAGEAAGRVMRGASTDKRGRGSSPATSGRRRVSGWCSSLPCVYAHAHTHMHARTYGLQDACMHACVVWMSACMLV